LWNSNPVASSANQRQLNAALCREDLMTVVSDLFETDTVRYADIVLPAASSLEFGELIYPYFEQRISAQVRAMDPPGQALPNAEIFRRLAQAMGYADGRFPTPSGRIEIESTSANAPAPNAAPTPIVEPREPGRAVA
jgi:anaerobic selenocysteine-containing dehydrogenase